MQGREICMELGWSKPEAKRPLSRLGILDRIILKWILQQGMRGGWWGWPGYKRLYRGADKSLARPERKQATATEDFEFHISYL